MSVFLYFVVWEWINIALEFTATAWVKLPRWPLAVIGVNLVTHPVFTFLLGVFGDASGFVIPCEICIFMVEAVMLMAVYGFRRWRFLLAVSLVMNAASYLTGVLLMV